MARFKTPLFGPHAGRLCADGVPVGALPADYVPPLTVAVPDVVPSSGEERYRRGIEGAAAAVFAEHSQRNTGQTYEEVHNRVVEARRVSARKRE